MDWGEAESGALVLGGPLLVKLNALLRTARTHDVSNQAFQRQLKDFMPVLEAAFEHDQEDELALVVVSDYFYLNGARIKAQPALLSTYHALMGEFERRELGGL